MWHIISVISSNLGMSKENIILLIFSLGFFLFYAEDVKIGVMMHFILYTLLFIGFYCMHWYYGNALILALVFFSLLALTLLLTQKKAAGAII